MKVILEPFFIMSKTIFLTMTAAGKAAMTSVLNSGFQLEFGSIQLGTGHYKTDPAILSLSSKWAEFPLVNGHIDTDNQILRFISSGQVNQEIQISEIGLFDRNGVLFAVASLQAGQFFTTEPGSFFSLFFAVALDQNIVGKKIKLSFSPQDMILSALMKMHLQHKNPHPQYIYFIQEIFKAHINHADPHPQYATKFDVRSIIQGYIDQVRRLNEVFLSMLPKRLYGGILQLGQSSNNVLMNDTFNGVLTDQRYSILVTPEGAHEGWNLSRQAKAFNLSVYNRSGTSRVGYSGKINWAIIDGQERDEMTAQAMPGLVMSGCVPVSGTMKISRPADSNIDISKCAVLITPEGAHEAWIISKTDKELTVNLFNRSGTSRVGYVGQVSYAVFQPNDGQNILEKGAVNPRLLMSGVSSSGTFKVQVPSGQKWDFTSPNYMLQITPEGAHEAWQIKRNSKSFDIDVYDRSGSNPIAYTGPVSWAVFELDGGYDLYRAGTHEITIPAKSRAEIHLVGAGGSGAGSLWASNISAAWLKMDAGNDTILDLGDTHLIAGGGKGGYRGVWNNGSAYIQGVAGEGGTVNLVNLGQAKLISQTNGEKAYLETAHDWCNRDTRGGLTRYMFGQGGEGGYTVETRKHRCYGAGGGSGAHIHLVFENTSNQPVKGTIQVGNYGRPDSITPELNNGKIGEAGCATVQITAL